MNYKFNLYRIILLLLIIQLSFQLTEDVSVDPQLYTTSYSKQDHVYSFQIPSSEISQIEDTAFTVWFRYNFYQDQDLQNMGRRASNDSFYSHIAGLYTKHDGTCGVSSTSERFHTLFYKRNLTPSQPQTFLTLCHGPSNQCNVGGAQNVSFDELDGRWAFAYQAHSKSLKKVVTYLRIPSLNKLYFVEDSGINNPSTYSSLYFVVGNCKPLYDFHGHVYNPRIYYKGNDIFLGTSALIDDFYSNIYQPTVLNHKTDNFYYNIIGNEVRLNSSFVTDPLEQFAHYDEYAIYGWIKTNNSIPDTWIQILRLTNWYLPQLQDLTKCGDREHAIFIRYGYYHYCQSNCDNDTNANDSINNSVNFNHSTSEIASWNWLYLGYQYPTKKYKHYIYYSQSGNVQEYSRTLDRFRLQNPKLHLVNTHFYAQQYDAQFKNWFIKLGPNSYKEDSYDDMKNQISCPSGTQQFNDTIDYCRSCDSQCQSCTTSPDQCDVCKYTTNRSPPECDCDSGYIGDLQGSTCQKCQSPCKTCQYTISYCLSCEDGYYLSDNTCIQCKYPCQNCTSDIDCLSCETTNNRVSTSDCRCKDTYYDDLTQCQTCVYPCQNCTSTSVCLTCQTTENRVSVNNCDCQDGYYDDNTKCAQCSYPCQNCSSSSQCKSCKTLDHRISLTDCGCQQGYYDNGSSCEQCVYPCQYCESATVCKTCQTLPNRNNTTECKCNDNYYDNNSECIKCVYPCQNCTSASDCTSCATSPNRVSSTDCRCNDTYFDDGSECVKCTYPCQNCTSTSVCLSCQTTENRVSVNNCDCQDGYYDDNTQCVQCTYPCQNCSSSSQCKSCKTLDHRVSLTDCGCQQGYYDNGSSCEQCVYPCQYCESATVCKTCQTLPNRNNTTECKCNDNYYDNNSECIQCVYPCQNCTSASDCTSCATSPNRVSSTDCRCNDTYFDDDSECVKCSYPCINCTSQNTCTSCVVDTNRSNSPPCTCNTGYFDNGSNCEKCHYKCQECENQFDQCKDSCSDNSRDFSKNCQCKDGKFDEGVASCSDCSFRCETCVDNKDNCTLCKSGNGRSLVKSQCGCSNTYFDDQSNIDCISCAHPCKNCTSLSVCTSCVERDNIDSTSCDCLTGFYENDQLQCLKCSNQCETCSTTADNCDTCVAGSNRQAKPSCLCEDGYYTNESNECVQCVYPCKRCTSESICLECENTGNRNPITQQNSSCDCEEGYFDDDTQCQKCDVQCFTCVGQSHKCIQCSEITRYGEFCNCKDGYYDVGVQQCSQCDYQCGTCETQSNNCLTCSSDNRDINNDCSCKDGFYEDTDDNICKPCQYPCKYCTSKFVCTLCVQQESEVEESRKPTPSCQCSNNYYDDNQTCQKCHSRCKICNGSYDNCTVCNNPNIRQSVQNGCLCQEYYYYALVDENTGIETCEPCDSNCKKCNKNECIECINSKALPPKCENVVNQNFLSFSVNIDGQDIVQTAICEIQCSECQEQPHNCTKCSVGLNRKNNIPYCDCQEGYYQVNYKTDCQPCQKDCKKCSQFSLCEQCIDSNKVVDKITGYCVCYKGFKDVHGTCKQCYTFKDQCLQQCPKNTIQDNQLMTCTQLNYNTESSIFGILIFCSLLPVMIIAKLIFSYKMKKNVSYIHKQDKKNTYTQQQQQELSQQTENKDNSQIQVDISKSAL